ncbi:hypothetical protein DM860_015966 [Cuscuta australis]|uniref:Uncharacterized protein n=1 Tax=Cuscuta australis TaxID=267555 RepID=A0A328E2H6_9ASTE|nr:hypothetical protein DM860_015966 [Cuscuta australis]
MAREIEGFQIIAENITIEAFQVNNRTTVGCDQEISERMTIFIDSDLDLTRREIQTGATTDQYTTAQALSPFPLKVKTLLSQLLKAFYTYPNPKKVFLVQSRYPNLPAYG